jgi:glycosyltransferase involved in cell wall biosynthesis
MSNLEKAEIDTRKRRFVSLTNIPSPYRLYFYKALANEMERRGWEFEVWFMAKTEPNRFWMFKKEDFHFPYRFFCGISPTVKQIAFHLNPGVIGRLLFNPPDVLLLAQWMLPTNLFGMPIARWLGRSRIIFWLESHQKSSQYHSRLLNWVRHSFYARCDAFATSGQFSREYIQAEVPGKPVYSLPNVVDGNIFSKTLISQRSLKTTYRAELGIPYSNRVCLIPARLVAEKALQQFFEAVFSIPAEALPKLTLLVAGDGPLRGELSQWMSQRPVFDVRLLGNVPAEEMPKLYAACEALALPSLSDPNPLSVIEACWAGLPLLLSDRVGNHPETLHPGKNGWLFNIEKPESVVLAVREFLASSDVELTHMGSISRQIAEANFQAEMVVKRFLDQAGL